MTHAIWVVAADAARARMFRAVRRGSGLSEFAALLNPDLRNGQRAPHADRRGHAHNAAGGGHSLQRNATEDRLVAADFGRRLALRLMRARRRGEFSRLYLVAEPRLLGVVRRALDTPTRRLLAESIDKDLTRRSAIHIRKRLPARL